VHLQSSILAYVDKSSRVRPERLCLCKEASGAGQLRPKLPKPAALIDEAEEDVLACLMFPQPNRTTLHRTKPVECPGSEIKRHMDDVGLLPNQDAVRRLAGAAPSWNSPRYGPCRKGAT